MMSVSYGVASTLLKLAFSLLHTLPYDNIHIDDPRHESRQKDDSTFLPLARPIPDLLSSRIFVG